MHWCLPSIVCRIRWRQFVEDKVLRMLSHDVHALFLKIRLLLPCQMETGAESGMLQLFQCLVYRLRHLIGIVSREVSKNVSGRWTSIRALRGALLRAAIGRASGRWTSILVFDYLWLTTLFIYSRNT